MLHVGQKLWMVYNDIRRGQPREVTVTRVGRKWADIDVYKTRVAVDTLCIDPDRGLSRTGRCYLSRDAYEAETMLVQEWNDFAGRVSMGRPPQGMTVERIRELRAEFGMPPIGTTP